MIWAIQVSYSELYDARRCPLKHELKWVEGWEKPEPPDSVRAIGTAWHKVLSAYYEAIKGGEQKMRAALRGMIEIGQFDPRIREVLKWMFTGYVQQYGTEEGWTVVDTEVPFRLPLPLKTGLFDDQVEVTLKGKIDLIIRDERGRVWVDDHKSCDAIPKGSADPIDDQLPLMVWAANQLGHGPVLGARYSYSRRKPLKTRELKLTERFWRRLVPVTSVGEQRAALGAVRSAKARYLESVELAHIAKETGRQSILSDPPANLNKSCRWDCEYAKPCTAASRGMILRPQLKERGFEMWRPTRKEPEGI